MNCPECGATTKVIRTEHEDGVTYRRRECHGAEKHRFSTAEVKVADDRRNIMHVPGVAHSIAVAKGHATWLVPFTQSKESK